MDAELEVARPEIRAGLKREILRILQENRDTIVRRATVPKRAVVFVKPDPKILNFAYASLDNFISFLDGESV